MTAAAAQERTEAASRLTDVIVRVARLAGNSTLPSEERQRWREATSQLQSTQAFLAPAPPPARRRFWAQLLAAVLVIFGILAAVAGSVLRWWGVLAGVVYGPDPIRNVEVVLAAGVIAIVTGIILLQVDRKSATRTLAESFALLSALVAVIALARIFVPSVAGSTGEPDCANARTYGVAFVASATVDGGVNARSGPSRTAAQVGRYPKGCLVGFDGFCVGDPVTDSAYAGQDVKRLDTRWLRIARHEDRFKHTLAKWISHEPDENQYIAGGVMVAQSLVDLESVKEDCTEKDPEVTSFALTQNADNTVTGLVSGTNTQDVQYAVYVDGPVIDDDAYRQVTPTNIRNTMLWDANYTAARLLQDRSMVVVSAVPCLSPNIGPFDQKLTKSKVVFLTKDGQVTPTDLAAPDAFDFAEAAAEACKSIE